MPIPASTVPRQQGDGILLTGLAGSSVPGQRL